MGTLMTVSLELGLPLKAMDDGHLKNIQIKIALSVD